MTVSITPHGAVSTIGGNRILVQGDSTSVLLDFGLCFGEESRFYEEFLQPRSLSKLRDLLALDVMPAVDGRRQPAGRADGLVSAPR